MKVTFNNITPYNQQYRYNRQAPVFCAQSPDKFVKTGLRTIANVGRSDSLMADKPMLVGDFLRAMCDTRMFRDNQKELVEYAKALNETEVKDVKIKQLIGYGSSALALETECGKVLKLTRENHFPMNRPVEDFDAEVFSRGKVGRVHYYFVEKCTPCESGCGYAETMREKIRERGYRPYDLGDWDDFQVGFNSQCELKLLDPECAQYKTPVHKLVQVIGNLFKNS